ncbi:pyridoxal phosphate-dependent aminotransferase [Elusimicrobiota bacterium]
MKPIKESATVAINQRILELRAQGQDIVHFGFGQSPFPVFPPLAKALQKSAAKAHYLPTQGMPELRKSICGFMRKYFQYDVAWENTFIAPGSKELLYGALWALKGPLIHPSPSWVSYAAQAALLNKPIHFVETFPQDSYKITPAQLSKACSALGHGPKIMILNSPNNPTGSTYKEEELKSIALIARENQVIIISDEIYALTAFEKQFQSICRFYPEGTILTTGLSKAFSAGGYRLGFMFLPETLRRLTPLLNALASETYTCAPTPIQYAALEILDKHKELKGYFDSCKKIHKGILFYLWGELTKAGYTCAKPEGGFYLFPEICAPGLSHSPVAACFSVRSALLQKQNRRTLKHATTIKKKIEGVNDSVQLCKLLLKEYGVAALPGTEFGLPPERLAFRIAGVDYDGAKALRAANASGSINEKFIKKYCPNIVKGADRLSDFLKR